MSRAETGGLRHLDPFRRRNQYVLSGVGLKVPDASDDPNIPNGEVGGQSGSDVAKGKGPGRFFGVVEDSPFGLRGVGGFALDLT
jgi:hypothetical protein